MVECHSTADAESPDAERAVLGPSDNNHAFYRVIGTIDTEDFFRDAHRTIFATMRRMAERSRTSSRHAEGRTGK